VRFTDLHRIVQGAMHSVLFALGLTACSTLGPGDGDATALPDGSRGQRDAMDAAATKPLSAAAPTAKPRVLPPPGPVRNWDQVRLQAAKRLVAAHPDTTYTGKPPDVLLAIPVLEVELNADGSVKRIQVLRRPGQAPETTQMAIDAVRRAAPFGDVSRLPKPWKFAETFLFDDQRRFKPRTLED
jgi:hypothetical protein